MCARHDVNLSLALSVDASSWKCGASSPATRPVILGVHVDVTAGEFVGILGHNGMGKTTLLRTIIGLLPATSGRIRLDGTEIDGCRPMAGPGSASAMCRRGGRSFPALSVLDNLRFAAAKAGAGRRRPRGVLDEVPAAEAAAGTAGGALSGGEQQILALARCLCGQPRCCCSTSRPRASSPPSSRRWSRACTACAAAACPSCWSSRTSTSSRRCRTAS